MKTLIFARKPKLPFEQIIHLTTPMDNFTLTVSGKVRKNPTRFAINIKCSGDRTLMHMNPRWAQGTTVFNTYQAGWGPEEFRTFSTLEPHEPFDIVIHRKNPNEFIVQVNDEDPFIFRQRYDPFALGPNLERTIQVWRDNDDIDIRHIALVVDPTGW